MLKNHLKIAWRNLQKNKVFSFINILGLALGIGCSLLIMLWVQDERSIDAFHKNRDYLYSIYERQYYDGQISTAHQSPGLLYAEMKKALPEVKYAAPYAWNGLSTFQVGDKIIKEDGNFSNTDFFKMFSFPLLEGNVNSLLSNPDDIAISRKMAADLFGSPAQAIGKTIRYENRKDLKVAAVFENIPDNSSYKFDFILPWESFIETNDWVKEWGNNGPKTFIQLREDANPAAFEKKIERFLDNYNKEQDARFYIRLGIQRVDEMYLHSKFTNGKISGGRIEYVRLFSLVALFILLIACINFMNLSTARSVKRAKEIGVRKVVGAVRWTLVKQFIGEALMLSVLAAVLAVIMVSLLLPVFNSLTQKQIDLPVSNWAFWFAIIAVTFITGLIAGSYPAIFLSSFEPIKVLKGTLKFAPGAAFMRRGLVVFQFALSIILIIGTIIISKQVEYVQKTNLGYDRENLIYIPIEGELTKKYDVFKQEALKMPGVQLVSRISQDPTQIQNSTGGVQWEGKDPNTQPEFTQVSVGYEFVKTMKLQLAAGREYSKDFATDTVGYILNESAAKKMNMKDAVGQGLTFWGRKGTIIGVVKDFHFNSLHVPIQPLILHYGEGEPWGLILVRTRPGQTKPAIASLEKICHQLNPGFPFTYKFTDQEYSKLYKSEQVVGKLSTCFAFLAIFISCLGLLGLAIFTAEQRTKEIGIRKVLGASVQGIIVMLSKDFLKLVLIALIIASPL
ncbi:MAG TPA: ABC transporter permease, partial [Chitinophagaceae bacterium]|nr:ABC transporter permease [Chitinophagaceae bacterium]